MKLSDGNIYQKAYQRMLSVLIPLFRFNNRSDSRGLWEIFPEILLTYGLCVHATSSGPQHPGFYRESGHSAYPTGNILQEYCSTNIQVTTPNSCIVWGLLIDSLVAMLSLQLCSYQWLANSTVDDYVIMNLVL